MQPRKVSEGWRGGSLRARSNTLLSAGFTISISTYPACPPSWWRGGTKNNYRRHIRRPRPSSTSENDEEGTVRLGSGRFRASPGPAFCATHCVQFIFAANSRPGHQETPKRCYVRLIVVARVARTIAARNLREMRVPCTSVNDDRYRGDLAREDIYILRNPSRGNFETSSLSLSLASFS